MAIIQDTIIAANAAFNRIGALGRQAMSYSTHPQMLRARGIASSLANSAWATAKAARNPMLIGAGVGAGAGVGYDYATNRRSNLRSMAGAGLKGGLLGGAVGLGYYGARTFPGGPSGAASMIRDRAMGAYGSARTGWSNMVARAQAGRGLGGL